MADNKEPVKCPKCGAENSLRIGYSEHCDYVVTKLDAKSDYVDVDEKTRDNYDTELIHITCEKCNTYWESIEEMLK